MWMGKAAHKRAGKGQWTYHDSLYKGPTPRGIYIPRLLSIIRHLPFPPPAVPLTSSPRLPGPAAGKSWLVSWWLDRERSRQGYRDRVWVVERIGARDVKVEKIIKKDVFLSSARLPRDFWRRWSSGRSLIWQPHVAILSFFIFFLLYLWLSVLHFR